MKLNFDDSCSTLSEIVDFETKVKEGKKHKNSHMKLEDVSDSASVSSGLTQQVKSGKTGNQHCSISMTKDPYSRVANNGKKTTQCDSAFLSESAVVASTKPVVIPVNVVGGRHEPDKNGTSRVPELQKKVVKESQSDARSSESLDLSIRKPVAVVPRNVNDGKHQPDENVTNRFSDKQNKPSQSDSRPSTKSAGLAGMKPVVIPVNIDGGRWEPHKNITSRVADNGKKTTQCDSAFLSESVVVASTKPVVIPVNVVGGRHEPDKNGTSVPDTQKNKSQSDTWSSSESESEPQASVKPAVIFPVKVDSRRLKPDENVTRVPDTQKNKSQSDTWSSSESESEPQASVKPAVVFPVKVDSRRLKPDETVTRVPDTQKNKSQSDTWSSSESESEPQASVKPAVVFPVKVDSRRLKPDETVTRTDPSLQKNVVKESQTDPWSSPDYVGQVSEQAGAELPVNVDARRYDSDENARSNVPGLHKNGIKKSKNETCNSAVSVPKVSRKSGALHSVTGDSRRHESRQNNGSNVYNFFLYRVPGLTRKKRKKSTYEMNMPTEPLTVTHEIAGVVFPEQGDSRRHENNQDVGRPVKKTSNEKKEINPTDDSDDITQTSKIASTGCDSLYSEHENVFTNVSKVSKSQDLICSHKRLCEINHCELLKEKYRKIKAENCALKKELLETKDINSQLKQQNLKLEYCCYNLRDRLRREEERYRSGAQMKQQLESTLSAVAVELRALRNDLMKASESNEREKDPVHKSHTLQDEISMLKLEINTMKNQNQEKEKTVEIIKEMNDFLRKNIQQSEERLAKTISQHCEQLIVLKSENNSLSTQLEHEKQKSETLKTEVESCHGRLDAAVQDLGQSHKSERDLERHFQETREEKLRLEETLSQLQRENMLLQQQLNEARNKADNEEETVMNMRGQFQDTIRRLRTENEKQKETNDKLIDECNLLKKRIYKYEKKKAAREAQVTPQDNLKLFRGTQTTSISQMEVRYKNLETENCRLQTDLESQRIKSGKYMQLYLEESKMRQSLQNNVNTTIEQLREVNTERLVEETHPEHVFNAPPLRPCLPLSSATSPLNSPNNHFMLDSYLRTRQNSTTFPTFNPWP
ncbi:ankyrin repeat domain-containing protein 26-like [Talpa occidentalis]|uniref:ankyrin repeat domain-containing protein 26-like n=1 Tax=Talpa occidentalis TaxID=50954 RepID=UPI0023F97EAB|nr:ankyrin repeat domain-containing protein 26-like [Talpa occidentalis]